MRKRAFLIDHSIANAGLILYGPLLIWRPVVLWDSLSLPVTQLPESDFWIDRLLPVFRLLGYLNLLLGVLGLFLIWRYQISRQPRLGYAVVTSTILAYLAPIVYDNTAGMHGPFEILELIISAVMFLTGADNDQRVQ